MVYIRKDEAIKKVCPILSIAFKDKICCYADECMFWSNSKIMGYGECEIKSFLKRIK